jgi:tRNA-2-methylthio-N6-dimethylallyladenosine synthase
MKKNFYIKTYGCQMNVYDTEKMTDVLEAEGYAASDVVDGVDLVILNTCHIREKAAEKVYSDIGRIRKVVNTEDKTQKRGLIAVAGCVAQAEGREIMRRAPAVNLVFGPQTYHRLPALLSEVASQRSKGLTPRVLDTDFPTDTKFDHLPRAKAGRSASAFLSVQEGCDKFCTYCVVPYTRGAEFSRPVAAIIKEAEDMVAGGVREMTLLGQNVNAYHGLMENGEVLGLAGLIRLLAKTPNLGRIRYTTSHPRDMTQELIDVHGEVAQCMPYLHLPIQSGSDKILAAMNRQHGVDSYIKTIDALRKVRPDIAISGDFIVGFPGETDADFEDTLALVERIKYAQAYSFKFSPRPGTPAVDMENQVDENVKVERLARLQDLLNIHQREFNDKSVGMVMPVLFEREGKQKGQLIGRTPYMQSVHVTLSGVDETSQQEYNLLMGDVKDVEIITAGPRSLEGLLVK